MDFTASGLSNDERGWVMTALSGIACVFGASVICVDFVIRQFPGKKDFRIQDSDVFLSTSLSLSFGVMLFSALYSMLPSSKSSLIAGGFTAKEASWILIVCFLGGVLGIQVLSTFLHHFMPSHTVDCEHSHEEDDWPKHDEREHDEEMAHEHPPQQRPQVASRASVPGYMAAGARRGLSQRSLTGQISPLERSVTETEVNGHASHPHTKPRKPSLQQRMSTKIFQVTGGKDSPEVKDSPCYGYSEPCGAECFKSISARGGYRAPNNAVGGPQKPPMQKSATVTNLLPTTENTPLMQDISEESRPHTEDTIRRTPTKYYTTRTQPDQEVQEDSSETLEGSSLSSPPPPTNGTLHKTPTRASAVSSSSSSHPPADTTKHHHHVPTNAFLSIGLQTSIAIALHKLPEGFITYATNHANPKLGVAVFLALFIHNITEGFALALPLYLAINSRVKAMLIAFVLGGLSQPIGAGVAAVWFKLAGQGNWAPSEGVYGGMFAVTAGIMASVALSLFSESLDLTHSRTLCMVGAFCGMGVLGISSALTA